MKKIPITVYEEVKAGTVISKPVEAITNIRGTTYLVTVVNKGAA